MSLGRRHGAVGLVAVALGGAVGAALLLRAGDDGTAARLGPDGIRARTVIEPRVALFADTVTAKVEVVLDSTRIDPESLRVSTNFRPFLQIRAPARSTRRAGATQYEETVYVLRCLGADCAPQQPSASREFAPARVTYVTRGGSRGSRVLRWPVLVVNSRIVPDDFERDDELSDPWRADLVSLPTVSYRISPSLLLGLLLGGAAVLALLGGLLVYAALPQRRPPEAEQALEPPELSPLDRALALLENGVPGDGAGPRRQALERVARELAARDAGLADEARTLAWAAAPPPLDSARRIATRVRSALEEDV